MKPAAIAAIAVAVGWFAIIVLGFGLMIRYSRQPGNDSASPATWPEASRLPRDASAPTIVLFLHPKCPCSRASLAELDVVMNDRRHHANAVVAFLRPDGVDDDWTQTDTWSRAAELPRTSRFVDRDGAEARRFGARTSGHVEVYDAAGRLLYEGGITGSRGHFGDNLGRREVLEAVIASATEPARPTYGCPIQAGTEL